MHIATKPV